MARKKRGRQRNPRERQRHISVRGIRRNPPDLPKLSQALVALALARAEAEAQAEHEQDADGELADMTKNAPEDDNNAA